MIALENLSSLVGIPIRRKSWPDPLAYITYSSNGWWWISDDFRYMVSDLMVNDGTYLQQQNNLIKSQLNEDDWEEYEKPIGSENIANMLGCNSSSPVSVQKGTFSAPNISWGFFRWGEADYIQISKSFHLTEVEIKVSYADFKKDKEKSKFKNPKYFAAWQKQIRNFYYAAPPKLANQILPEVCMDYGVISAGYNGYGCPELKVLRKSKNNTNANPITNDDLVKLARLLSFRLFKEKR